MTQKKQKHINQHGRTSQDRSGNNHKTPSSQMLENMEKSNKNKVKKPKHLKRKLESMTEKGDQIGRDMLVKELEEFQKNKKRMSQKNSIYNINNGQNIDKSKINNGQNIDKSKINKGQNIGGSNMNYATYGYEKLGINGDALTPFNQSISNTNTEIPVDFPRVQNKSIPMKSAVENANGSDGKTSRKRRRGRSATLLKRAEVVEEDQVSVVPQQISQDPLGLRTNGGKIGKIEDIIMLRQENEAVNTCDKVTENFAKDVISQPISSDTTSIDNAVQYVENNILPTTKRQRGKGRKGRKNTSDVVDNEVDESHYSTNDSVDGTRRNVDENVLDLRVFESAGNENKVLNKQRRCIGRKPVTDYVVGEIYDGKVVYVKPFGVFLDIGCHSDAFCHVSRLSDDFVESPESMYKQGDEVKARVVEINRKEKRITVSMQSENKTHDERLSIEARKERLEKRRKKRSENKRANKIKEDVASMVEINVTPAKSVEKPKIEMTSAELKRARKLARRAERRAQN